MCIRFRFPDVYYHLSLTRQYQRASKFWRVCMCMSCWGFSLSWLALCVRYILPRSFFFLWWGCNTIVFHQGSVPPRKSGVYCTSHAREKKRVSDPGWCNRKNNEWQIKVFSRGGLEIIPHWTLLHSLFLVEAKTLKYGTLRERRKTILLAVEYNNSDAVTGTDIDIRILCSGEVRN